MSDPEENKTEEIIDNQQDAENVDDTDSEDASTEGEDVTSDDAEDKEGQSDETQESDSDDSDSLDDEAEFIKQYGLPEEVKTLEDALEYAKNLKDGMLPELKRGQTQAEKDLAATDAALKQLGFENGVRDVIAGRKPPAPSPAGNIDNWEQKFYVAPKLQQRVNNGELSAEDARLLAPVVQDIDGAVKSVINIMAGMYEHFNNTVNPLQTGVQSITSMQKDNAYKNYSERNKGRVIPREKLDKVLDDIPKWGNDYQKAHNYLLVEDNKTFSKFLSDVEKGTKKKLNRKGRRFMKGGGLAQTQSMDYDKYLLPNGEIDQTAINKLDSKTADKVLDHFIERAKKAG